MSTFSGEGPDLLDDCFATARLGLEAAVRQADLGGQAFLLESLLIASRQSFRLIDATQYGETLLQIHQRTGDRHGEALAHALCGVTCGEGHLMEQARCHFAQAEVLCRDDGYQTVLASVLIDIAWAHIEAGDHADAVDYCHEALALARATGSPWHECEALVCMARLDTARGLGEQAAFSARHALEVAFEFGENAEAYVLLHYAPVQRMLGDFELALTSCHRAAQISRESGRRLHEAMALDEAGNCYGALGRHNEASAFHRRAATAFQEIGNDWRQAIALDHLAHALRSTDLASDQAVQPWCEAERLLDAFGDTAAQELKRAIAAELARGI